MFTKLKRDLLDWGIELWLLDAGVNLMLDIALFNELKWHPFWVGVFALASGLVITILLNAAYQRFNWPQTRDISHIKPTQPVASKRDLQDKRIINKTILIERLVSSDNSIAHKTFIDCSIVGPSVMWTPNKWNFTGERGRNINPENAADEFWVSLTGTTHGAIRVEDDVEFRDCTFFFVGFVIPKATLLVPNNPTTLSTLHT